MSIEEGNLLYKMLVGGIAGWIAVQLLVVLLDLINEFWRH